MKNYQYKACGYYSVEDSIYAYLCGDKEMLEKMGIYDMTVNTVTHNGTVRIYVTNINHEIRLIAIDRSIYYSVEEKFNNRTPIGYIVVIDEPTQLYETYEPVY